MNKDKTSLPEELRIPKAPGQAGNIILSLLMAALGLTFIALCERHVVGTTILWLSALAFIAPGVGMLFSLMASRKSKEHSRGSVMTFLAAICGCAAIGLGIVILMMPGVFRNFLCYLFGILLIIGASWQFDVMMRRNHGTLYPAWLVFAPVILVAAGVVIMTVDTFKGESNEKWMLLLSGIGFTIFGLIGLFISYFAIRKNHADKKLARESQAAPDKKKTDGAATVREDKKSSPLSPTEAVSHAALSTETISKSDEKSTDHSGTASGAGE